MGTRHRVPGELGPQTPHTLKDARALAALLRERGEDADAAAPAVSSAASRYGYTKYEHG